MKRVSESVLLEKIVGGGQAIGTLENGKKAFVWGGLPGELVSFRITKKKSKLVEGVVEQIIQPSSERIEPRDGSGYLSTSPWQTMSFQLEQQVKARLINEAFSLHGVSLPEKTDVFSDGNQYGYRNKVEFSWWGDTNTDGTETLDLAFFRRGSKGKMPVEGTSLAHENINWLARKVRDFLREQGVSARSLKTLLIRCDQSGDCVFQLYVKEQITDWKSVFTLFTDQTTSFKAWPCNGWEVIYSDPRSPASRITERLVSHGDTTLTDTILNVPFRYATEGFFQVNIPVYEQVLRDMAVWTQRHAIGGPEDTLAAGDARRGSTQKSFREDEKFLGADRAAGPADSDLRECSAGTFEDGSGQTQRRTVDMYSGVGTIGLTIGGEHCTLVEVDENAVREMRQNVSLLHSSSQPVLAKSEDALDYITSDRIIILDPPRAGLHARVVERLLETTPPRIVYLSCNPVTQARDVALLLNKYDIVHHKGYNFFPRTPHIEHLVVLDKTQYLC